MTNLNPKRHTTPHPNVAYSSVFVVGDTIKLLQLKKAQKIDTITMS